MSWQLQPTGGVSSGEADKGGSGFGHKKAQAANGTTRHRSAPRSGSGGYQPVKSGSSSSPRGGFCPFAVLGFIRLLPVFDLLKTIFSPVGFKGTLSLLEIFFFFQGT